MAPDMEATITKEIGGRHIYTQQIGTDAMGRVRCPEEIDGASLHALFFGGSFTFGEGVLSGETLPPVGGMVLKPVLDT